MIIQNQHIGMKNIVKTQNKFEILYRRIIRSAQIGQIKRFSRFILSTNVTLIYGYNSELIMI